MEVLLVVPFKELVHEVEPEIFAVIVYAAVHVGDMQDTFGQS